MILNRKVCFVFIDARVIKFFYPIRQGSPYQAKFFFLRNHWQDNFQNLLNYIKSRSSLPQVECVRGSNIFPSHNQSLTRESLTRPIYSGFLVTPQLYTRWRLPTNQINEWKITNRHRFHSPTDTVRVTCDILYIKIIVRTKMKKNICKKCK